MHYHPKADVQGVTGKTCNGTAHGTCARSIWPASTARLTAHQHTNSQLRSRLRHRRRSDVFIVIDVRIDQTIDRTGYILGDGVQCLDDEAIFKGYGFAKAYAEGRLEFCFALGIRKIARNEFGADCEYLSVLRARPPKDCTFSNKSDRHEFLQHLGYILNGDVGDMSGKNEQAVFVAGVEGMEPAQIWVPFRGRIDAAHRFSDLFTGKLYLSLINGSFKSILFAGERELDEVRLRGLVMGHPKQRQVQCGPQIVDSIPNNEGEFWWNGFLGFGPQNYPSYFALKLDDKFDRAIRQIGINFPVKIIDVMLGPL